MERLTINEIIEHCKRKVDHIEKTFRRSHLESENCGVADIIYKEYWEHRQVAEWLEELQAFKDKEEQGLMIILPVAEETPVWRIIRHSGCGRVPDWYEKYETEFVLSMLWEWGITVFATEAEAEEALAKMGGK